MMGGAPIRCVVALTLAALGAATAALGQARPAATEKAPIVIGVRIDTPPFAWRDASGGYLGFLYNLCSDAAARAGYPVERWVAVDAASRRQHFEGRGAKPLDVLCDPTTITLARIDELHAAGLEFSPIVFVANGSYVLNPDAKSGLLTGPEADAGGCHAAPGPVDPGVTQVRLAAGFVIGTTAEQVLRDAIRDKALRLAPGQRVCPVEMDTHWRAAQAFCSGELRYYFGDQDILRSVIAMTAKTEDCPEVSEAYPLSYEPYALALSRRLPEFRQDFVKALYELFHHEPTQRRFQRSFDGRAMSPFLETLFRINSIPAGEPSPGADERERAGAAERAP